MNDDHGLSHHACKRLQQRSIPLFMVDYLDQFGSSERCGGSERLFFDKAAKHRLASHLGGEAGLKSVERWLGVYAVVGDKGIVVTVGHRTKRQRLH